MAKGYRDEGVRVTPTLDVIIVNWNAGELFKNCLESIVRYGNGTVSNVIVVDNGSSDGSARHVGSFDLPFRNIQNENNHGFGRACNQGAENSVAKYLLFLNPDTELLEESLARPLAFMESDSATEVGICGVQLFNENGDVSRSCARFPTFIGFTARAFGIDRIFPRLSHDMSEWDHCHTRIVDQVIGAFFLVRRELFLTLGGFDERFFVYFEEVDFAYRAKRVGSLSVYLADAQAFHAEGGSTRQVKARRLFYSWRSRLLYVFKHFSWFSAAGVLVLTLVVEPLSRSVLAVLRRSWSSLKEIWSAYAMLLRWLPKWVEKA